MTISMKVFILSVVVLMSAFFEVHGACRRHVSPQKLQYRVEEMSDCGSSVGNYSLGSNVSNFSFSKQKVCVICAALGETPENSGRGSSEELPTLCEFCTHQIKGEKSFACGHAYPSGSCIDSEPEAQRCPPCRLYCAVQAGEVHTVQALLMVLAPVVDYVVFPHGHGEKSLLHVAVDVHHVHITLTIMLALLTGFHIMPSDLAGIVHQASKDIDGFYWDALRMLLVTVAQSSAAADRGRENVVDSLRILFAAVMNPRIREFAGLIGAINPLGMLQRFSAKDGH